jgi:hypothetical protein
MPILKYKNPTTQLWEPVVCGSLDGNGGTANGIPITSDPSDDTTVWIDPNENGSGNGNGNYITQKQLSEREEILMAAV